jgi:hypothetical protein
MQDVQAVVRMMRLVQNWAPGRQFHDGDAFRFYTSYYIFSET